MASRRQDSSSGGESDRRGGTCHWGDCALLDARAQPSVDLVHTDASARHVGSTAVLRSGLRAQCRRDAATRRLGRRTTVDLPGPPIGSGLPLASLRCAVSEAFFHAFAYDARGTLFFAQPALRAQALLPPLHLPHCRVSAAESDNFASSMSNAPSARSDMVVSSYSCCSSVFRSAGSYRTRLWAS